MSYRRAENLPDPLLASTLNTAGAYASQAGVKLEVVLNGDFFDLDAPLEGREPDDSCREANGAASIMQQILIDHPAVISALGRLLAQGHRVVFIPGNHDSQLVFPGVRLAVLQALQKAAGKLQVDILFRSWFHRTSDGIHIEHGHQYDPMCALERMFPTQSDDGCMRLEDTIGTLSSRRITDLFGLVNPYAVDPFSALPQSPLRALRDSIGSAPTNPQDYGAKLVSSVRDLLCTPISQAEVERPWLAYVAKETGYHPQLIDRHRLLFAKKASAADIAAGLTKNYDYGKDVDRRLRNAMATIAQIHKPKAVVIGHTHEAFYEPSGHLGIHANSGTWAPLAADSTEPVGTFLWFTSLPRGNVVGSLKCVWRNGTVT